MLHIAYDSDDLPWVRLVHIIRFVAQQQLLADRIFIGKIPVRKSFIDDHTPGRGFRVAIVEIAAAAQWNFQCMEHTGSHFIVPGEGPFIWRRRLMPEDRKSETLRANGGRR